MSRTFADAAERRAPSTVGPVEPWSAEDPRLYDAQRPLGRRDGDAADGLPHVRIDGDRFLVNGAQVIFRGMNRHETHPVRGRVFDESTPART